MYNENKVFSLVLDAHESSSNDDCKQARSLNKIHRLISVNKRYEFRMKTTLRQPVTMFILTLRNYHLSIIQC